MLIRSTIEAVPCFGIMDVMPVPGDFQIVILKLMNIVLQSMDIPRAGKDQVLFQQHGAG